MPDPVLAHVWNDTSTGAPTNVTLDGGAPFTPAAGKGYVLIVLSGSAAGTTAAPTSISPGTTGLSFSYCGGGTFSSSPIRGFWIYSSQPAGTPASGSLIANHPDAQSGYIGVLIAVTNPGATGALANGLIQQVAYADSDPNNVGTLSVTLGSAALAGSVVGAAFASNIEGLLTPTDASFTELSDVAIAGGRNLTVETMWRAANDDLTAGVNVRTSADAATTAKVAGIIFEVVNATAAPTPVGKSLAVSWDVRAKVGKSLGLVWNVLVLGAGVSPTVTHAFNDTSIGLVSTENIDNAGADYTPVASYGYLVFVLTSAATLDTEPADTMDGSGMGLTTLILAGYTLFSSGPQRCLAWYVAQPAGTPAAGKIVGTYTNPQGNMMATALKVQNPASYGPLGLGMIQQIKFGDSDPNNVSSLTITLDNPAQAGSVIVGCFASNINGALTPVDVGFTELSDHTLASGKNLTLETQVRHNSDDVSVGASARTTGDVATTAKIAGVVIELLGTTVPTTPVGRSLALTWNVAVVDPPTVTPIVVHLAGAVTYAELGLDPTAPGAPEFYIKVNGVWTLVAGARAEGA